MNLFEVKRKNLRRFDSLMFAVELLVNSPVILCFEHAQQQFYISHFTSLEVLSVGYYMIIDFR